ncbi:c-type cytochrome [Pedobacter sp. HMF7647]|uniref:C-type cytochrome n=1 Tax=Hufsiella arboris TaxID=2695275 RepID=A0A7K1YB41_9SPHI|nr:c-type cytochrome [Hufsiella arboris]MXV51571.1 c-type cytochrome [Hufsiella arboris]
MKTSELMKASFLYCTLVVTCIFSACSNSPSTGSQSSSEGTAVADSGQENATIESAKAKFAKGYELLSKSDCKACHDTGNEIVGPSFERIAARYVYSDANITHLAERVITGVKTGEGVWGKAEMTPHVNMSKTDAEEIIKYVLSMPPKQGLDTIAK